MWGSSSVTAFTDQFFIFPFIFSFFSGKLFLNRLVFTEILMIKRIV